MGAIALAWALAVAAEISGHGAALHHDALIEGKLPYALALALFLVAWQAMIAAMMLPSSLPLVRLFAAASADQPRPRAAMAAFLGGYTLIWTAFGWLAFVGDTMVHATVDRDPVAPAARVADRRRHAGAGGRVPVQRAQGPLPAR